MNLSQSVIESYSKFIEFDNEQQSIEEFKALLDYGMKLICEHLNMSFEYSIETFGAVEFNTLISQYEPVTFAIKIYDATIFDNLQKIKSINSKKKKTKFVTTESVKLLLSIYLEKYFENVGNVVFSRNCLSVDSQNLFQFNAKIYVFASSLSQNLTMNTDFSKVFSIDFEALNENYNKKTLETDYNYIKVVNIIKNICLKANVLQDTLLIETLVYNVPNNYFSGDLREQVIKSLNYIKFSNLSQFNSITNANMKFDKDYFVATSVYNVYKDFEILANSLI